MYYPYEEVVDRKIIENDTIKDLLLFNETCYWWYIDDLFYRSLSSSELFINRKIANSLIVLFSNILPHLLLFYDMLVSIIWSFVYKKYGNNTSKQSINQDDTILYRMSYTDWREKYLENHKVLENIYGGNIINILSQYHNVKYIFDLPLGKELHLGTILKFIEIQKFGKDSVICSLPVINYWSMDVWREERRAFKHFNNIFKTIDCNYEWYYEWSKISGISVMNIRHTFKHYIKYALPIIVRNQKMYDNIIKNNNIIALILKDEQSPTGRGMCNIANKNHVPIIGIQHGGIAKHPAYLYHDPRDVLVSRKNVGKSFPIVDVTCVWGASEYELLVNKAGYPKNQVVVTGNPRYDALGSASKLYSRDNFCKRYNIRVDSKIVLWTPSSFNNKLIDALYLEEMFNTIINMSDIVFIIKSHPNDIGYRELVCEYVQKYKVDVIVPDKLANTTEMVYISNLVIVHSSTVGQEAIAFHKPMIVFDLSEKPDYAEYVKEGCAIDAYNKGELKIRIAEIFDNKYSFTEKQDTYITNHMHEIDGHAAKRCADTILREIIKSQNE